MYIIYVYEWTRNENLEWRWDGMKMYQRMRIYQRARVSESKRDGNMYMYMSKSIDIRHFRDDVHEEDWTRE